jgi:cytoskeletal protein CcmA (bactofilin family)
MFKHQDETMSTSTRIGGKETIIADGVKVEGDFISEGDIFIEGEVTGNIVTKQNLRIGETAKIHANISAKNATIAGKVYGNLSVEETLELIETAHIYGDIQTGSFSVALGAQINGQVAMGTEGQKDQQALVQDQTEFESA